MVVEPLLTVPVLAPGVSVVYNLRLSPTLIATRSHLVHPPWLGMQRLTRNM